MIHHDLLCLEALLLMEEILHHLLSMKPCENGIFSISTGAGFLPSTISKVQKKILPSSLDSTLVESQMFGSRPFRMLVKLCVMPLMSGV